ncbi:hypothetical protein FXB40_11555 [Bradyrhizobium rifense]|uniref:Uncharacterized protein n=1 Tax=Bradyrhizobium rifense TaxID=515499 RepID=A0A5D3KH46_9BRAD|nr:hypothetical protein FXB40_11555 [Bradyrhizobium rifense]
MTDGRRLRCDGAKSAHICTSTRSGGSIAGWFKFILMRGTRFRHRSAKLNSLPRDEAQRKQRRPPLPKEFADYIVEIDGWDWAYSFSRRPIRTTNSVTTGAGQAAAADGTEDRQGGRVAVAVPGARHGPAPGSSR